MTDELKNALQRIGTPAYDLALEIYESEESGEGLAYRRFEIQVQTTKSDGETQLQVIPCVCIVATGLGAQAAEAAIDEFARFMRERSRQTPTA